jgi:flavodoxin
MSDNDKRKDLNALLVFDSRCPRTERIAHTISSVLENGGRVHVVDSETNHAINLAGINMLIVGSPTRRRRPSGAIRSFLASIPAETLHGLPLATYDVRARMPGWVTGSAARTLAGDLRKKGGQPLMPAESFFTSLGSNLDEGELERAATWAGTLHKMHRARRVFDRSGSPR